MAITAVQAIADGGAIPDNSTQLAIINAMNNIVAIDGYRQNLYQLLFVQSADGTEKATIQPAAALFDLEMQGRKWINQIASQLGLSRLPKDYYGTMPIDTGDGDLFGGPNSPFIGGANDNG